MPPTRPVTMSVTQDPATGLWVLPTGDQPWARWVPTWHSFAEALRRLVMSLADQLPQPDPASKRRGRGLPSEVHVPFVFGLVACPDNDYNPLAVAVVIPGPSGRLDLAEQVGWLKDEHVRSLQPSIVQLADATGGGVGCYGYVEFDRWVPGKDFWPDEDDDWREDESDDDPGDPDDEDNVPDPWETTFTPEEVTRYLYTPTNLRARINGWEDVHNAVQAHTRLHVTDRILPAISRRTPLLPAGRALRGHGRPLGPITVTLTADQDHLDVHWNGVHIARPYPDARDLFARTHARVVELGGHATAQAQLHTGSLELLVQDATS